MEVFLPCHVGDRMLRDCLLPEYISCYPSILCKLSFSLHCWEIHFLICVNILKHQMPSAVKAEMISSASLQIIDNN